MKIKRLKLAQYRAEMRNKPLRRSRRLLEKNDKSPKENMWLYLPLEIKFKIFSYLDAEALGKLALSSRELSYDIQTFLQTVPGLFLLRKDLLADASVIFNEKDTCKKIRNCRILGLLLKAATFTQPKPAQMLFAYDIIEQLGWHWGAQGELLWEDDAYFMCFGEFLSAFTAKWNNRDLHSAFPFIQKLAGMDVLMKQILRCGPGRFPHREKALRLYFKFVYFMPNQKNGHKFFLVNMLRDLSIVEQARILYILFGPTRAGEFISWSAPLTSNCFSPYHEIFELAYFINLLGDHEDYRGNKILSLIEALTILPQPWHPAHIIHLLLQCEPKYLRIFMEKIFHHGGYPQFAVFVVRCIYLLFMLRQDKANVSLAVETIFRQYADKLGRYSDQIPLLLDSNAAFNADERELWSRKLYLDSGLLEADITLESEETVCQCYYLSGYCNSIAPILLDN